MRRLTLEVSGMACDGCANHVRTALANVEGVRRAEVSLEGAMARVIADDEVEPPELVEAVEKAGYGATPRE